MVSGLLCCHRQSVELRLHAVDHGQAGGLECIEVFAEPMDVVLDHATRAKDSTRLHPFDTAVVLADGRVLFAGGVTGDPQTDPTWTAALYDATRDSWSTAASMPVARAQATAVLMKDGRVLMFGGYWMLNPAPTLEYTLGSGPAVATRSVLSAQAYAALALEALVSVAAIGLAVWLFVRVRRKRTPASGGTS